MGVLRELKECRKLLDRSEKVLELIEYRLAIPGAKGLLSEEVVELRWAIQVPGKLSDTLDKCIEIQQRLEGVRNDTVRY